jgi:hypothetical protein
VVDMSQFHTRSADGADVPLFLIFNLTIREAYLLSAVCYLPCFQLPLEKHVRISNKNVTFPARGYNDHLRSAAEFSSITDFNSSIE